MQSDTYKRLEVGDTVDLYDWFTALGVTPASYTIVDGRIGTIDGSILTATNWGRTQVTVTGVQGAFRIITLEVRPKGAVAMPMVVGGRGSMFFALKANGTVWCGAGGPAGFYQTGMINGKCADNIIEISCGQGRYFMLEDNGCAWGWGWNGNGNLGVGHLNNVSIPERVGTASNIVHLMTGGNASYYIDTNEQLYGWGANTGVLGNGNTNYVVSPIQITTSNLAVIDVQSSGFSGTVAVDCAGRVWQWGRQMGSTTIAPGSSGGASSKPIMIPTQYLSRVVEVATSGTGSCTGRWALTAEKELYRWGYGTNISSGTSPTTGVATSIVKYTPLSGVIHIRSTCASIGSNNNADNEYITMAAMTEDGTIYTWGRDMYGGLGTGGALSQKQVYPTAINGITDTRQYAGMFSQDCFVTVQEDGSVWTWGWNNKGQLCDNTTTNRSSPIRSGGGGTEMLCADYASVTGGLTTQYYDETNPLPSTITIAENETLTIDLNRITKGISGGFWLIEQPERVPVTGEIEADSTDKAVATIGRQNIRSGYITVDPNQRKVYGETTITLRDVETGIMTMLRVRVKPSGAVAMPMVVGGQARAIALKANGTVWGWGRNDYGDAGLGVVSEYIVQPEQTVLKDGSPLTDIVQIAAGGTATYALKADGTVWSWGDNSEVQLGIGPATDTTWSVAYAVQVVTGQQDSADGYLHDIVRVAAGSRSAYAITKTGEVLAWGRGAEGQLGTSSAANWGRPHYVSGVDMGNSIFFDALDISASYGASMFLRRNGAVYIAGSGNCYFGNGTNNTNIPLQVYQGNSVSQSGYLENIVEVAASGHCVSTDNPIFYALNTSGEVYAWGYGETNALGLGDGKTYGPPQKIQTLDGEKIIHIAATGSNGDASSFGGSAVTSDGRTYTWGGTSNNRGQLGNGTFTNLHLQPKLTTSSAFHLVTIDGVRTTGYVGTKQDGTVWGWGGNWYAQLGAKSLADQSKAICVRGINTSVEVNGAAIYRGSSAAAAYGADAGAAGTQCPGEIWLSATPQGSSGVHKRMEQYLWKDIKHFWKISV